MELVFPVLPKTHKTGFATILIGVPWPLIFNDTRLTGLRFVDRDMVVRYHWGLGIGHVYSHGQGTANITTTSVQAPDVTTDNSVGINALEDGNDFDVDNPEDGNDFDVDNPELGLEDREDDLGEEDDREDEPQIDCDDDEDDEQLVAMDDMYGPVGTFDDYHD